ncbi:hypothetical protein [Maricaulis maris]|uniref:hypothetical protein n=1 Tax=Maricaulis maris TaxID=74318 RepID=UPI003B8D201C
MTREELYRRVWAVPMNQLGASLGVSGSYLARICDQLNVPRPVRGYWAKKAVGKAPPQTPLPEALPGAPVSWSPGELPKAVRARTKLQATPKRETKKRIPRNATHGLLVGAKAHFGKSRRIGDGEHIKPFKRLLVDITTTERCLDGSLRLANELFNGLTMEGHRVGLAPKGSDLQRRAIGVSDDEKAKVTHSYRTRWAPDRPTVVFVGTVAVGLAIVETTEMVEMRYFNGRYVPDAEFRRLVPKSQRDERFNWTSNRETPTGRLRVIAYSPYPRVDWSETWTESKPGSLRHSLGDIARSIESAARDLIPRIEEAERQAELERIEREAAFERYKRAEDQRKIEASRQESKEMLASVIDQWSQKMSIARFFYGVEQHAAKLAEEERAAVMQRLALARDFLGSADPMDAFMDWKTPDKIYSPLYPEKNAARLWKSR